MSRTSSTKPAAAPAEPLLTIADFVVSDSLAVPVAGLLAHKPVLVDAQLTETQWQDLLDAYAKHTIDA